MEIAETLHPMSERAACRACGSKRIEDLGACAPFPESVAQIGGRVMPVGRLLRCLECGLGQRHPCMNSDELAEIYRDSPADAMDYPPEQNMAWHEVGRNLRRLHADSAKISVLDIGCHTGLFLASLPEAWKRFGIEGAIAPAEVATTKHHVTIVADALETTTAEWHGYFDVVTLFDVLEHLPDPSDGLLRASRLLKPNGVLMVSTGDMDSWTWLWSRGNHWYLQAPLHISFCSRKFFAFAARRQNLLLQAMTRISHTRGTAQERVHQVVNTLYWGMRERGSWWRWPRRLLALFPGSKDLPHLEAIPWSMKLRDHAIAVFTKRA